ncbi:MAG: signal peptidase I [Coriobacteriia bacterium]|nr:signal peptidase I [Coriobacteriia bacterium]
MSDYDERNDNDTPQKSEETSLVRWLIETALLVLLAFALAQGIKAFVVQPFVIPTGSMQPTIGLRNYVLAERLTYRFSRDPAYGEIVVFNNPTNDPAAPILIKRCIAVGGQTIDLKDGKVLIDGEQIEEPYTHGKPTYPLNPAIQYPFKVPDGQFWMMGDNRTNSGDSREFGPVDRSMIIGHAVWTYWPADKFGALQ